LAKNDKDLVKSKYDKRLELVDEAERYRTLKAQGSMFHDEKNPRKLPEQRLPPSHPSNQQLWRRLSKRPRSQLLFLKSGRLLKKIWALLKKSSPIFRLVSPSLRSHHTPGLRNSIKRKKMTLLLKLMIKTQCG